MNFFSKVHLGNIFIKLLINCFIFSPCLLFAQLSGEYTVGSGGDYATITEVANDLNNSGVDGHVVINIETGNYNEQFTLQSIPGTSETNTITFRAQSGDSSDVMIQYEGDTHIMQIISSSNLLFKNLTFQSPGDNYGMINLIGYVANITFQNCHFSGDPSTSWSRIIYSEDEVANLLVENSYFNSARSAAVYLIGTNQNPIIKNNIFENIVNHGLYIREAFYPEIKDNNFIDISTAIYLGNSSYASVQNNRITGSRIGIQLNHCHGSSDNYSYVANNYIYTNENGDKAFYIINTEYLNILYNTAIFRNASTWRDHANLFIGNGCYKLNIINNNLINELDGHVIRVENAEAIDQCDYNNYYNPASVFARWDGKNCFDFYDLKRISGMNNHSVSAPPNFIDEPGYQPQSAWLDGAGTPIESFDQDIEGNVRDEQFPDIGCLEFSAPENASPPISGIKSVGGGGDYSTLNEAFEDLAFKGVSGEVRLRLLDGIYTEQCNIGPIAGSSASNPVFIESFSGDSSDVEIQYDASGNDDNYIFNLLGASHLKFKKLSFRALDSRYGRIFEITGQADSLEFSNNHFMGIENNSSSSEEILIYSDELYFEEMEFNNNRFDYGTYAIYFNNSSNQYIAETLKLENNYTENIGYYFLSINQIHGIKILNNWIQSNGPGIRAAQADSLLHIEKNILNVGYGDGLRLNYCQLPVTSRGKIFNNMIFSNKENINQNFVTLNRLENVDLIHNTLKASASSNWTNVGVLYTQDGSDLKIKNNIIVNHGDDYAYGVNKGSAISQSDHNSYFTNGSVLASWDGNSCDSLADLQNQNGMDQNSLVADPNFNASDDLHVNSAELDAAGTGIDYINVDIDNEPRHPETPDIGADEFYLGEQNPPYIVSAIEDKVYPEDSGVQIVRNDLNTVFEDDDQDYLSFSATSAALEITPHIDNNVFSLIIADDFSIEDIYITVTATDLGGQSVTDTFLVTITPLPDPPVAINDTVTTLINAEIDIFPLENDYDPEGEQITISEVQDPRNGNIALLNDSTIHYNPDVNFSGWDSLLYSIEDAAQGMDSAYIFIEVTNIFSVEDTFDGISNGAPLWGDFDNDRDLDLFLFGAVDNQNNHQNIVYRNAHHNFHESWYHLPGQALMPDNPQGATWCDIDNDNDLDLLISGKVNKSPFTIKTRLYTNNNGYFTRVSTPFFHAWASSITCVDYDNDGDLDVFITGNQSADLYDPLTKLYRNNRREEGLSLSFTDVTDQQFPDVCFGSAAWADYDEDGDQDLLLSGALDATNYIMRLYENEGGTFDPVELTEPGIMQGKVCWGDCDNDGDLDILYSGKQYRDNVLIYPKYGIYLNNGDNDFSHMELPSSFIAGKGIAGDIWWIDYNNDGFLDIAACGYDSTLQKHSVVLENQNMNFTLANLSLPNLTGGMGWGDYNKDGKLDVCVTGIDSAGNRKTILMKNNTLESNQPPEKPGIAAVGYDYNSISLTWNEPADDHTPSQSLSYNIKVSESPEGSEVVAPHSHLDDGLRKIVALGNVSGNTSYKIDNLTEGRLYYFSVQAVDGAYAGSEFTRNTGITVLSDDFMEEHHTLPPASARLASADNDKDGKMDLLMSGEIEGPEYITSIYNRQNDRDFVKINDDLPAVNNNSIQWEDFDGDSDPDVLLSGFNIYGAEAYLTNIFYNQGESYVASGFQLQGVSDGDARWSDYDIDGDLDVLIMGGPGYNTKLFENRDSLFQEVDMEFTEFTMGSIAWGDYDSDGDDDLLIIGSIRESPYCAAKIYRNDLSTFSELDVELVNVKFGRGLWGDYDMDGDLDILLCGLAGNEAVTYIYKYDNIEGEFTKTADAITGLWDGAIQWVDLDNDGDLDIIGNGKTGTVTDWEPVTIYYIYEAGAYHNVDSYLGEFYGGDLTIGDLDNDLDLDLIQTGLDSQHKLKTRVFRNETDNINEAPTAPENLEVSQVEQGYIFSWDHASDDHTSSPGLTYNLRLGTAPGSSDLKPCNSDTSGYHFVPGPGNVGHNTHWELRNPPQSGSIYWSVQAIDNAFLGSPFAEEQQIVITDLAEEKIQRPANYSLSQNYPNPFNPETVINFALPVNGQVLLEVYNILGQSVATLADKNYSAGYHSLRWKAGDLPSGVYFYNIIVTDESNGNNVTFTYSRKMLLIK